MKTLNDPAVEVLVNRYGDRLIDVYDKEDVIVRGVVEEVAVQQNKETHLVQITVTPR